MNTALVAASILAAMQLLDLWSTHLFRSVGIPEGNPIFGPTFNKVPFWVAGVAKMALSAVLIGAALLAENAPTRAVLTIVSLVVICIYVPIVIGNFRAWYGER